MKKFSKIFFYLTAVVLLSWLLPWLLQFAASKPGNDPFTLYSCVTKRFAYIQSSKDNGVKRYDANGTEYTVAQFDSILPTFYYRQVRKLFRSYPIRQMSWERSRRLCLNSRVQRKLQRPRYVRQQTGRLSLSRKRQRRCIDSPCSLQR